MESKFTLVLFITLVSSTLLSSCSEDDSGSVCTPIAASNFPCADQNKCLSVTATWCYPDAENCSNNDVDLTLERPDGIVIGQANNEFMSANGCVLDGDEQADVSDPDGNGEIGPWDENITCSPQPPDTITTGNYVIGVSNSSLLFGTDVLVSINVDGDTSCQIVQLPQGVNTSNINVSYP